MKAKKNKGKRKNATEQDIQKIYASPRNGASFRGVDAVRRALKEKNIKVSRKQVEEWLSKNDSFTLHRPVRYKFKRRAVEVRGIGCIYEIDLMDLPSLAHANDGYRYLLNCIDCFSKYAHVRKLKRKNGEEAAAAMKDIFDSGSKPLMIHSDAGKEFTNSVFQKLLKDYNVHFYTTNNETKASIVERFNLTLSSAIGRYSTHNDTLRYIDVLDDLVHSYNNTYHSTIKKKPSEVTKENERQVFMNIYGGKNVKKKGKCKFSLGDRVRISKSKRLFRKNYKKSWSVEVFKIVKIYNTNPCVYELMDDKSEVLIGRFYEKEMSKVTQQELYQIEKILRRKKQRGKEMVYVKWLNYDASHNSWIPSSSLQAV